MTIIEALVGFAIFMCGVLVGAFIITWLSSNHIIRYDDVD